MGQYHKVVNLDKRQYLNPHTLGDGLKLMEQVGSSYGTGSALLLLLAASNGRGGGDYNVESEHLGLIGSWAGDRIVVVGNYCEDGDIEWAEEARLPGGLALSFTTSSLYHLCSKWDAEELREWCDEHPDRLVSAMNDDAGDEEWSAAATTVGFTDIAMEVSRLIEAEGSVVYSNTGYGWRQRLTA